MLIKSKFFISIPSVDGLMKSAKSDSVLPFLDYATKPNETVKGGSYGDWIVAWHNWLLGEYFTREFQSEFVFLTGNMSYGYTEGQDQTQKRTQQKTSNKRLWNKGLVISQSTTLFIPVMTTFHTINERYEGSDLLNEGDLRHACDDEIQNGGKIYLTVETKSHGVTKVVNNLMDYNFTTPLFDLEVSEKNPLKDRLDVPIAAGSYKAIASGFYVILGQLPSAEKHYRFKFGGKGKGEYETDAEYDITVLDSTPANQTTRPILNLDLSSVAPADISGKNISSSSPFIS